MDFSKMRTPDWILGGCMLALIIDLLFFPWHHIASVTVLGVEVGGGNIHATEAPNSFWAWLALLVALAVLAAVVIRRLTTVKLPDLPIAWEDALFYASIAVLALLLIKLVAETSHLGFGAYLGILLAAGGVYGGFATRAADKGTPSTPPTAF